MATYSSQVSALTRAVKSGDPNKVRQVCAKAVKEWNDTNSWPDSWADWQRALDDSLGYGNSVSLENL